MVLLSRGGNSFLRREADRTPQDARAAFVILVFSDVPVTLFLYDFQRSELFGHTNESKGEENA